MNSSSLINEHSFVIVFIVSINLFLIVPNIINFNSVVIQRQNFQIELILIGIMIFALTNLFNLFKKLVFLVVLLYESIGVVHSIIVDVTQLILVTLVT